MLRRALGSVAVLSLGASVASAQNFDIQRVAEGVYAAIVKPGAPVGSNGAFIVNDDDVVVVDTHFRPSYARELQGEIKKLTPLAVHYVVNTHWHNDHTQGNQAYANAWPRGAEYVSHDNTREDIQKKAIPSIKESLEALPKQIAELEAKLPGLSGADADRQRATIADRKAYLDELKQVQITLPTLTFDRSLVLHRPSREIRLLYFGRGHTRGDIVVYLPKEKVVIGGDLLTAGIPLARDGFPAEWADTLAQVAKLDVDVVVPGHGGVKQGKKLVEDRVGFLRDLVAQVKKGVGEGKDAKAIHAGIELSRWESTFDLPAQGPSFKDRLSLFVERATAEAKGELK
jgi:glyoxylase-like metal-dependent hydrolase (beta-lactamase superfamily II)